MTHEPVRTVADLASGYTNAGADISPCGRYRYLLWREWRGCGNPENYRQLSAGYKEPKSCLFVMLNPSTADGRADDPTIRRCAGFAKRWGFDRLEVANLFAHRATDPKEILRMLDADEPFGIRNQDAIERHASKAGTIVCAWGNHGAHLGQDETVLGWLEGWDRPLRMLGLTAKGHPKHPLYVGGDTALLPFPRRLRQIAARHGVGGGM